MDYNTSYGLLGNLRRSGRKISVLVMLSMLPIASGCYGRFPLTHGLWKWNGRITDNKIIHNLVFWVLAFFGIYWFASLGDAIIFNLIEFWTGTELEVSREYKDGDKTVVLKPTGNKGEAILTVSKDGQVLNESHFIRTSDTECEIRDEQMNLKGKVIKNSTGGLNLVNNDGRVIQTIPSDMLPTHAGL